MVHKQITKRNRVYSLESNKLLRIAFTRKYVNYLEPALKKINEKTSSASSNTIKQNGDNVAGELSHQLEKLVRFEVDMAMAVSAKEFAWSRSLEAQLQLRNVKDVDNVGGFQQHHLAFNSHAAYNSSVSLNHPFTPHDYNAMLPSIHISKKYKNSCISKTTREAQVQEVRRSNEEEAKNNCGEEEERTIKNGLRQLRMVLPGGKEMGDDVELLTEIASYITCLQLQVNILQCLVEN
ncbi:transcription factor bHLH146 [Ziziphus jujuba]|uniref:Transcription factor bHLH146 n=2 Tax=Ziziphus jujuba TaxID=326968 RepID=A0A6P3YV18_ZIZJJ|nr:transcription factor bHLH146 [Ziziphus jujuba]KAH7544681.1 hypothetical protein FEM48_Zijuj01G0011600 [Ziziphus jujuba var. spinosa]